DLGEEIKSISPSITLKGVYIFRTTANLFGYNVPKQILYQANGLPQPGDKGQIKTQEWDVVPQSADKVGEENNKLYLDNAYNEIKAGSFIAILKAGKPELEIYQVKSVKIFPRTEYGISGKTTQLTVDRSWWNSDNFQIIRETSVYIQSESLDLVDLPIEISIAGNTIELNGHYPNLQIGQQLILVGETEEKQRQQEIITLKSEPIAKENYTEITLKEKLQHTYQHDTVTINANIAHATQGETVQEILGSGDATQSFQKFTLRQPPLTFTSASTPNGTASTLQVRVNSVLWHEVPTLDGRGALERVYITRQNEAGQTTVIFGNGKTGARLPTGQDNIHAIYRKGLGQSGNVRAEQLTMLLSRPLGLRGVTNFLPAMGGDDPESLDRARQNAPLTVLTLDRIVSLQDYEDFARAFAGIAKALATWTWSGQKRGVFLTIAGVKGTAVTPKKTLYKNLFEAIRKVSDRHVPLQIATYRPAFFRLKAKIKLDADFGQEQVLNTIRQALQTQFSFERGEFGRGIALSQVYAVMQAIPGVTAVDIDQFHRVDTSTSSPQSQLMAAVPVSGSEGEILAAELLLLDSAHPPQLEVMS
ncbi:MAG: putative baseplate assembly protein, partial [Oculatellaceae cyanobacterium bins.114]|nr:putative baseplate assembly protein [Oculatellaceae cyanobacterium bins.114]